MAFSEIASSEPIGGNLRNEKINWRRVTHLSDEPAHQVTDRLLQVAVDVGVIAVLRRNERNNVLWFT